MTNPQEINNLHRYDDLDRDTFAHHHSIGDKPNQAASGSHTKHAKVQLTGLVSLYSSVGVPGVSVGVDGDICFRQDTPGTVNQRLYVKSAGAWVGIL